MRWEPHFLTGLFALCLTISVQAQQLEPKQQHGVLVVKLPQPLVLVNNQETTNNALILNPNDIENVEVLKGADALERFGEKATDGAVVIELKQELPLARLQQVYKAFNVTEQQQKLTLAINGRYVKASNLLLADLRQIKKIEVADFDTALSRWSFDERFLNIITKPIL